MTELPDIPGGWTTRDVNLGQRRVRLTLPLSPDAFLDDPAVLEANERNDYSPYWAHLWPSALQMAKLIADKSWTAGTRALELGAGVGLTGIAGLVSGLDVTFSDYDQTAIQCARFNAFRNGLGPEPEHASDVLLDWRDLSHVTLQPFPVIVGCDVLYEEASHIPVLNVLDRLLSNDGVCWLGDPGRRLLPQFCELASQRGYRTEVHDEAGQPISSFQISAFRLLILKRESRSHE